MLRTTWLCGLCGFCGSCVSNIRETSSTSHFAHFWSLWILCGSCVVLVWVVLWFLVTRGCFHFEIVDKDINVPSCPGDGLVFFADRWSCLDADADADADACQLSCTSTYPPRCASSCSLWTAKKICPSPQFVICSVPSSLETTFTNGENDHG